MVAGTIASNRDAVQNQGAVVTDGRSLPRSASGHSGSMTCSSAAAQSASLISLNSPAACCISPSSRRVDDPTNRPDGRPSRALVLRGRDHLFFAGEEDIHRGELMALALPRHPPLLREQLTQS